MNPLIDGRSSRVFLPMEVDTFVLSGHCLDEAHKVGIVKILQDAAAIAALQDIDI